MERKISRRNVLKGMTVAMATGALTACGGSSNSTAAKPAASSTAATEKTMAEILAQKPTGKTLVLATNNYGSGRDTWVQENAKAAGFNIEIAGLGAGDLTARVISEVNNPTTNVVWGPSEDQFNALIEAGALVEFTPDWKDKVAGVSEENGYSWPYEIQPKVLVCNPDIYTKETAPKHYRDLWEKEEFHGKYAVPTAFGGNTPRAIIGGILGQYLDQNGELGVSDEGWAAIKAYLDNGYKTPKGEDDFGNMASGAVPITYTFASGLKSKCETFNITPIIAYTEEGEPTNTNQLGVVANKDPEILEESMRFANWLGSAEVIGEYASINGNMVANSDAADKMVPIIREVKENYKPQNVDWAYVNSMMDEWVAKIQLEIF